MSAVSIVCSRLSPEQWRAWIDDLRGRPGTFLLGSGEVDPSALRADLKGICRAASEGVLAQLRQSRSTREIGMAKKPVKSRKIAAAFATGGVLASRVSPALDVRAIRRRALQLALDQGACAYPAWTVGQFVEAAGVYAPFLAAGDRSYSDVEARARLLASVGGVKAGDGVTVAKRLLRYVETGR